MEKKPKLTREELSAIRSAAGRKGGLARKRDENKVERVQMQVKRIDRDVLMRYAAKKGMTMTDAFHFLYSSMVALAPATMSSMAAHFLPR